MKRNSRSTVQEAMFHFVNTTVATTARMKVDEIDEITIAFDLVWF